MSSSVWVIERSADRLLRLTAATGEVVAAVPVHAPSHVAQGEDAAWVLSFEAHTLTKIDNGSNQVVASVDVPECPNSIVLGEQHVWIGHQASWDGLSRLDTDSLRVEKLERRATPLVAGRGSVWFREHREFDVSWLVRLDVGSDTWLDVFGGMNVSPGPALVHRNHAFIGLADSQGLAICGFDLTTGGEVEKIPLPVGYILDFALTDDDGFLIVHYAGEDAGEPTPRRRLLWVDRRSLFVEREIALPGDGPAEVAVAGGFAWLLDTGAGKLVRLDSHTLEEVDEVSAARLPTAIVAAT